MLSMDSFESFKPMLSSFAANTSNKYDTDTNNVPSFKKIFGSHLYVSKPVHWLESRFHFSFAEYHKAGNQNFGVLRVMNDDIVKPQNGFDMHPHRDQEIISYIVDGHLTHQDSQGNKETLGRGSVQYMSAGRGVFHSEMNESNKSVRFIQIWISPWTRGLPTQYGSRTYNPSKRLNSLHHIVAPIDKLDSNNMELIGINQDANVFVSEVAPGKSVQYELNKGRQCYLLCIEGDLNVSGETDSNHPLSESLTTRDALEMVGPTHVKLEAPTNGSSNALLLMIEMKKA